MNIFSKFNQSGTHSLLIKGEVGDIEVELIIPAAADFRFVAILGHPHPLYGGTMQNKVVTTLAAAYKNHSVPTIKFNFRGVGFTAGEYNAGIGESLDMLMLISLWKEIYPKAKVFFAGFSFGSYVAYRSAAMYKQAFQEDTSLITIAPSVHNYNYMEYSLDGTPWLVVQGDIDEVVEAKLVYDFVTQFDPELPLLRFEETGHFFHGKLVELKSRLTDYLTTQLVSK